MSFRFGCGYIAGAAIAVCAIAVLSWLALQLVTWCADTLSLIF